MTSNKNIFNVKLLIMIALGVVQIACGMEEEEYKFIIRTKDSSIAVDELDMKCLSEWKWLAIGGVLNLQECASATRDTVKNIIDIAKIITPLEEKKKRYEVIKEEYEKEKSSLERQLSGINTDIKAIERKINWYKEIETIAPQHFSKLYSKIDKKMIDLIKSLIEESSDEERIILNVKLEKSDRLIINASTFESELYLLKDDTENNISVAKKALENSRQGSLNIRNLLKGLEEKYKKNIEKLKAEHTEKDNKDDDHLENLEKDYEYGLDSLLNKYYLKKVKNVVKDQSLSQQIHTIVLAKNAHLPTKLINTLIDNLSLAHISYQDTLDFKDTLIFKKNSDLLSLEEKMVDAILHPFLTPLQQHFIVDQKNNKVTNYCTSLVFKNSNIVLMLQNGEIGLWDIKKNAIKHKNNESNSEAPKFDEKTQKFLVLGTKMGAAISQHDRLITLWDDPHSPKNVKKLGKAKSDNAILKFNHNEGMLALIDYHNIKLWNTREPTENYTLRSYDCSSIAFSPYEKVLASGSDSGEIKIWNLESIKCICTLKAHDKTITDLVFSPKGQYFVSASTDGAVKLWRMKNIMESRNMSLGQALWRSYYKNVPVKIKEKKDGSFKDNKQVKSTKVYPYYPMQDIQDKVEEYKGVGHCVKNYHDTIKNKMISNNSNKLK